jgi:hypothetical protein
MTPPNGDHIDLETIIAAYSTAAYAYHHPEYALAMLCNYYRAVDVYHALAREAEAGTIQAELIDPDKGYILSFTPTEIYPRDK